MTRRELLESTRRPVRRTTGDRGWTVPSLTILFHPDPARVGEVARLVDLLGGQAGLLSRIDPVFAQPGREGGEPLADPYLSRDPVRLVPEEAGVRLSPERGAILSLEGKRLCGPALVSHAELDRGVVLELGERVVLLLHRLGPPRARQPKLGLVGESEALERHRAELVRAAGQSVPVLFCGETGTGKELAARAVAGQAEQRRGPFVAVNVAALPPSLAASELFGREAGAYTGAGKPLVGRFAEADGGTLFLDEIGAAPLELQAMLLRALESREIQPLGSGRTETVDVRVMAATDEDLEEAVRRGAFREALYHRLAGYRVVVPPLRERRDDIGRLFFHFLAEALRASGDSHRLDGLALPDPWLSGASMVRLARHPWPGNVRQLALVASAVAAAARGGEPVQLESLPLSLGEGASRPADGRDAAPAQSGAIDEEALVAALCANRWRIGATARSLGISRNALYALMDASGQVRKAKDVPEEELRQAYQACGGDVDAMADRLRVSSRGLRLRLTALGLE